MRRTKTAANKMVWEARSGTGPLSRLESEEVIELAALHAPYGKEARDKYFRRMRELADKNHPTQYA